jgi:hypothetical protein
MKSLGSHIRLSGELYFSPETEFLRMRVFLGLWDVGDYAPPLTWCPPRGHEDVL